MNTITSRFVLVLFAITVFAISAQADTYFTGVLNGGQETPPNASAGTGFGRVTLNEAQSQINVTVFYGNPTPLGTNVTIGHIHRGAPGVAGPIVFDLMPTPGATSGSVVNATFAITPAQVADLKAGLYYFNIHTTGFPGGEIRGQIYVDSPYIAYMDNNQENPATVSNGRGSGVISVNTVTNQALVTMTWNGLTGPSVAGHVHTGRSRTNGGIVCDLSPPAAASGSVVDRLCTFSPAQITSLRTAQFYLNLHTAAFPGGEIRGQIQRRRSTVLDFDGDGATDYAIARNNAGANTIEWWIAQSGGGVKALPFGVSSEFVVTTNPSRLMACDYDNDGRDDPIIWRSAASPNAGFLIHQSSNNTIAFEQFGTTGDHATVVYDYDGDGRCDPAAYRPTTGTWYYRGTSNNPTGAITYFPFGTGSFPSPGDVDGDGRGDFRVQSGANWWTYHSSTGTVSIRTFGTSLMFLTPGDYDGDGKVDLAGTLTESGNFAWYYVSTMSPSQDVYLTRRTWGLSTGSRAQGDYDGDGRSDYAVWNESQGPAFWVLPSNGNPATVFQWGQVATPDDYPIAEYNNR